MIPYNQDYYNFMLRLNISKLPNVVIAKYETSGKRLFYDCITKAQYKINLEIDSSGQDSYTLLQSLLDQCYKTNFDHFISKDLLRVMPLNLKYPKIKIEESKFDLSNNEINFHLLVALNFNGFYIDYSRENIVQKIIK